MWEIHCNYRPLWYAHRPKYWESAKSRGDVSEVMFEIRALSADTGAVYSQFCIQLPNIKYRNFNLGHSLIPDARLEQFWRLFATFKSVLINADFTVGLRNQWRYLLSWINAGKFIRYCVVLSDTGSSVTLRVINRYAQSLFYLILLFIERKKKQIIYMNT